MTWRWNGIYIIINGLRIIHRGVSLALTGDYPKGISYFEAFIKETDDDEEKAQRQSLVDALKKSKNTLTEEVLLELLKD